MSPSPDWYPDPTNASRLRYWDGVTWTQWVSAGGDASEDPVSGPAPPPPIEGSAGWAGIAGPSNGAGSDGGAPEATPLAVTPPSLERASGARPAPTLRPYRASVDQVLLRGGLGVAALGGIVATFAAGRAASRQPELPAEIELQVGTGAWTALVGAILVVGAAAAPWLWAQLSGIALATVIGLGLGFAVISFRTNTDRLESDVDVSLASGGVLLLIGSIVALVGVGLALAGIATRPVSRAERPVDQRLGVTALVLGIAGFPFPFASSLGVAFGLLGMAEGRAFEGGRGLAIAGFVVGLVALVIWSLAVIGAMFAAQPS